MERYKYRDVLFSTDDSLEHLCLEKNSSSIIGILRLIIGTADCRDDVLGITHVFRINYCQFPCEMRDNIERQFLCDVFGDDSENLTLAELNQYFKNSQYTNRKFFHVIEEELIRCLIADLQQHYLVAFIHLYRLMEAVSYSYPLLYTSHSKDYQGTYTLLQKYFKNDGAGELKFFSNFIKSTYHTNEFYNTLIEIDFNLIENETLRTYYFQFFKGLAADISSDSHFVIDDDSLIVKISFLNFFELLITLRNRYFHLAQGAESKKNHSSIMIPDPNLWFSLYMPGGIYWISTMLLKLIEHDLDKMYRSAPRV
ncbi:hypothetical protein ICN84_00775 [Akkermansia glycaniphila]|uniref:hypothetical protein n=1 Tax=Akkermansia glycaniphila TaxID=1679444 RepID=UPI001C0223D7|nr:hypothetical protein [Akkermansia glycaniphila]MBT9448605.1 hypothetical protein [Akkermansia glycaniphila]